MEIIIGLLIFSLIMGIILGIIVFISTFIWPIKQREVIKSVWRESKDSNKKHSRVKTTMNASQVRRAHYDD